MPGSSINNPVRSEIITPDDVRDLVGINEQDADDPLLQKRILDAQVEAIQDLAKWVQGKRLYGALDGENRTFEIRDPDGWTVVADQTLDKKVTGADLKVYALDSAHPLPGISDLTIESVVARHGRITLTEAPAQDVTLFLDGYLVRRVVEWKLLQTAVALLVGYYVDKRMKQPGKQALAHPNMKREGARGLRPQRDYLQDYRRVLKKLRGPVGQSAGIRTALGRRNTRGVF